MRPNTNLTNSIYKVYKDFALKNNCINLTLSWFGRFACKGEGLRVHKAMWSSDMSKLTWEFWPAAPLYSAWYFITYSLYKLTSAAKTQFTHAQTTSYSTKVNSVINYSPSNWYALLFYSPVEHKNVFWKRSCEKKICEYERIYSDLSWTAWYGYIHRSTQPE